MTQVMAKGFEVIVFEFRAIISANHSYGITVPLVQGPDWQLERGRGSEW
jgi:hypothetical protein